MHKNTMKLSLHVIMAAGYGYPLEWEGSEVVPRDHRLTFRDSIRNTIDNLNVLIGLPAWMRNLPIRSLRDTQLAYDELGEHLQNLVDQGKRNEKSAADNNILNALVCHSMEEEGGLLSEEDVIGNSFLFLIAGHESTYIPQSSILTLALTSCCMLFIYWQLTKMFKSRCTRRWKKFAHIRRLSLQIFLIWSMSSASCMRFYACFLSLALFLIGHLKMYHYSESTRFPRIRASVRTWSVYIDMRLSGATVPTSSIHPGSIIVTQMVQGIHLTEKSKSLPKGPSFLSEKVHDRALVTLRYESS
jgi:Cytochrome P450